MNSKLVESLVQVVESLPLDDYAFFQNKLMRVLKQNQPSSAQQIFVIRQYSKNL